MRRPHFRLRSLLVVVAATALALGGGTLAWRAEGYRRRAAEHGAIERRQREKVRGIEDLARAATDPKNAERCRADAAYEDRIGRHHAVLKAKYLRAAARPWESVAPDPAPP